MAYPAMTKQTDEVIYAMNDFLGGQKVSLWYSDAAPELHAACRTLGIRHDTADPHRHETNGVIERCNRTVIEGARTALYQANLA